jgi:hypothetical protein
MFYTFFLIMIYVVFIVYLSLRANWDGAKWDGAKWDGAKWDGIWAGDN